MSVIIETNRLRLRKFIKDDGAFVLELVNTPGWLEFIGNRGIYTVEEAEVYILTGPMNSYLKEGFGLYMVELSDTGLAIGMCGLIKRDSLEDVDLGFAFLPEFYGKGYAFEAGLATLEYAHSEFHFKRIVAITDLNNIKSINLLKKLSFIHEKNIRLPNEKKDLMLFSYQTNYPDKEM